MIKIKHYNKKIELDTNTITENVNESSEPIFEDFELMEADGSEITVADIIKMTDTPEFKKDVTDAEIDKYFAASDNE